MKIRIQFAKYGKMVYLGHLDVLRYFQKALRRAEIDIAYSKGFSPHPILSFAAPLGVGLVSCGEYADMELNSMESSEVMKQKLNAAMVPGMEILDMRLLPEGTKNAMSCVAAADYCLTFREGFAPTDRSAYFSGLRAFLDRTEICVTKETKKGSREVDLRPLIYDFFLKEETGEIFLQLSSGSVDNIKPSLVMKAYHESAGIADESIDFELQRLETYYNSGTEEARVLTPLREAGTIIETDSRIYDEAFLKEQENSSEAALEGHAE